MDHSLAEEDHKDSHPEADKMVGLEEDTKDNVNVADSHDTGPAGDEVLVEVEWLAVVVVALDFVVAADHLVVAAVIAVVVEMIGFEDCFVALELLLGFVVENLLLDLAVPWIHWSFVHLQIKILGNTVVLNF